MNVFNKVTIASLKKNKTRTIVTIIEILLATALICAVTTFTSSMIKYGENYVKYEKGDWHGKFVADNFQKFEEIKNSKKVTKAYYDQPIGYAKIDSKNKFKPYIYVLGGNDEYLKSTTIHLISGKLPQNSSELIVPSHLWSDGGIKYNVGDTITLELGDRVEDGVSKGQDENNFDIFEGKTVMKDEVIQVREKKTYKVVGSYAYLNYFERLNAPGYMALTMADGNFIEGKPFNVFFKVNKGVNIEDFAEKIGTEVNLNKSLVYIEGVYPYRIYINLLIGLVSVILVIVMQGTIFLIYNSFAISISDRTKQFGLLSSIGATKKQMRKMVLFEAFAISLIGIPLGILVGIGGIGITIFILGNKFASVLNYPEPMHMYVSWEAVAVALVVAFVTALISAWIPSRRATKISAIEAIRQNTDIKIKENGVKTSKLTYKLFGLPGVIASKHYKRSRKKYRATVISLFISIVLFTSASALTEYMIKPTKSGYFAEKADLWFKFDRKKVNGQSPNEILNLLKSEEHVKDGIYTRMYMFDGEIKKEYVSQNFIEKEEEKQTREIMNNKDLVSEGVELNQTSDDQNNVSLMAKVIFVNDNSFKNILAKNKLNEADYFKQDHPISVVMDKQSYYNEATQRIETQSILKGNQGDFICSIMKKIEGYSFLKKTTDANGNKICCFENNDNEDDIINIPNDEACVNVTFRVGDIIDEIPYYIYEKDNDAVNMIYPESMIDYVCSERLLKDNIYEKFYCYLKSDNHTESLANINETLSKIGILDYEYYDFAKDKEMIHNVAIIVTVFAYSFVVLISLIAVANVFNIISTNINLRRREFAMLKSVGMTSKDFDKMMKYECLIYGLKSLLFGLPVSIVMSYLIYRRVDVAYQMSYCVPWVDFGIVTLGVFAVIFFTMLYSMCKVKKENPIDALKNENL